MLGVEDRFFFFFSLISLFLYGAVAVVVILCYVSVASSCAVWASSAMCNHGSGVQQSFGSAFFVDKPSPSDVAVQFLLKALFFFSFF